MQANSIPVVRTIAQPRLSRPFVAWMGVNFLDAILTFILLGLGGIEGNPALSRLLTVLGPTGMLSAKLALAAAVGLVLMTRGRNPLLVLASRLMGLVVAYNAIVLAYYVMPSLGMPFTS